MFSCVVVQTSYAHMTAFHCSYQVYSRKVKSLTPLLRDAVMKYCRICGQSGFRFVPAQGKSNHLTRHHMYFISVYLTLKEAIGCWVFTFQSGKWEEQ